MVSLKPLYSNKTERTKKSNVFLFEQTCIKPFFLWKNKNLSKILHTFVLSRHWFLYSETSNVFIHFWSLECQDFADWSALHEIKTASFTFSRVLKHWKKNLISSTTDVISSVRNKSKMKSPFFGDFWY